MTKLKELVKERKFWILISLEVLFGFMFFFFSWLEVTRGRTQYVPPVIFQLAGIFGFLANGIPPLFYSREMAKMYNRASWGVYKITPRGARRLGIFIVSVCIIWLGYLVYDNHGIINLWRIVMAVLKQ